MHKSLKRFRHVLAVGGACWIAACAITAPTDRHVDPMNPVAGLWQPPVGHRFQPNALSLGQENIGIGARSGSRLSGAIRAAHFWSDGGELQCGRATLVVPEGATADGAYFVLEDVTQSAPEFEIDHSANDLTQPFSLRISYHTTDGNTSGFDPGELSIYWESTPGRFTRIPSHVDRENQSIVAETMRVGRYVLG